MSFAQKIESFSVVIAYMVQIALVLSKGYATFWNVVVMAFIAFWMMEPRNTEKSK